MVRFPPTSAAFRSSPLRDKPRPLPDFSGTGSGRFAVGFETLNRGQMIAAPGLGEKETERNYGLKGLEGRAKNKVPATPDPKLLLLPLQRGWVFRLFYQGESAFCVTWKSRTLMESVVILLSNSRVVPVVLPLPGTHPSAKHGEKQIIPPLPGDHLSASSARFN